MSKSRLAVGAAATAVLVVLAAPSPGAADAARDTLARSIHAHGGDTLTAWKTLVIEGTIDVQDGVLYHAAYRLWAKMPGKLRVEHDLTADRGRRFDQYFMSGGVAWLRRNLLVGTVPLARMQRWLDECYGVALYAKHAAAFTLQPDALVEWQVPSEAGSDALRTVATRPAWVLQATIDDRPVTLSIDKERYFLLQVATPEGRRVFSDFAPFAGRTLATRINEYARGRQGETFTPIVLKTAKYDVAVEDWLFEEDKPAR